ncbi:GNAT family N-acetyltransferase [Acidaminobacter sp. JC074]|uniref:GNAT family N-acetyltransferase n=1 Tax=Acidaminobacter sp. JC074 TaxID=2530199 RepID=UPI001F0D1E84|nr:GNAT family N-acetyltransferase [Acidaminobacter sp. JC074]MCH4888635.1 GNAT family N-acetyltransferase [Acidaminobacter sp. JC074]
MIEVFDKEWVIDFLRKEDEISNLNMIGAIQNIEYGIYNNPNDRLRMYVDDLASPRGVILREHDYWYYVYAKDDDFIYHVKENFFNELDEFGFNAVDKRVYDILLEGEDLDWDEVCELLYYDPKGHRPYKSNLELTDGCVGDAVTVDDHYTYKDETSYDFIYDDLKNRPSSFYRVDGEAVSWVMLHRDNSMGIMYTKEAYRGKNIAFELSMDLIGKLINKNQIPFIHIEVSNKPSFKLADKCGFKRYKTIYWFGIKR